MNKQDVFMSNGFMIGKIFELELLRLSVPSDCRIMIMECDFRIRTGIPKLKNPSQPYKHRTEWPDVSKTSISNNFFVFIELPPDDNIKDIEFIPIGPCEAVLMRFPDNWGITEFLTALYKEISKEQNCNNPQLQYH